MPSTAIKAAFELNTDTHRQNAARFVSTVPLAEAGTLYRVEIKPVSRGKTASQRSWFHKILGIFAKKLGYSPEELKKHIKVEAWGYKTVKILGREYEVAYPSEKAKIDQYSHLIETTYRLAAEQGVWLPPADKYHNKVPARFNNIC